MTQRIWQPQELAFLDAIHSAPRDDAPRLIYADWLEEYGGQPEYAEFIRLQCRQPYIGVTSHPSRRPCVSTNYEMPGADQQEKKRLERLLVLVPHLHHVCQGFWEEHFRGLPVLQVELSDGDEDDTDLLLQRIGPAARLDLILHTAQLTRWMSRSLMARVDILRIWPIFPADAEDGAYVDRNSQRDDFWEENIPLLAASPIIDRLYRLNPCDHEFTCRFTVRPVENLARCRELLEPRVYVEYDY